MNSSYNNFLLKEFVLFIIETAHDANIGKGYGRAGGYSSTNQTLGGQRTMGASIYPYLEKQSKLDSDENETEEDNFEDDIILSISAKIDSFRPNFDPNNKRKDNRTLGANPMGEARWGGSSKSQLPQNSKGMVTQHSRALNSPKNNKGTAMGGQNTQISTRRQTGSTRDFSAGASNHKNDLLNDPIYDFSDILGHEEEDYSNIDRIKKLTWILQNSDE